MDSSAAIPLRTEALPMLPPEVVVPTYGRSGLPGNIVHIGVGAFHRSHQAEYLDDLLVEGLESWSIAGVGVLPTDELMASALLPQDCLYTLVTRDEQQTRVRVIGAITEYAHLSGDEQRLIEQLAKPETKVVSLTITEGGYPVDVSTGEARDEQSPVFRSIARALDRRRRHGVDPFTVLSCDNVMHNGRVARAATLAAAEGLDAELSSWIAGHVAFPSSMVDRITPATEDRDRTQLERDYHIVDRWPVVAEPFRQWVIEDVFTLGRPPWEDVGAMFTSDVEPYELLKLRLLNAAHSSVAYLAKLSGFDFVHDVARDRAFDRYMRRFLDEEATPALPMVPGIDIGEYKETLLRRFANPEIADQVDRLCLDGSAKFPIFLVPTIEQLLAMDRPIDMSMLAIAGWCSYLLGVNDSGLPIELASDPLLQKARAHATASLTDPAAFLEFSEVFPPSVAQSPIARRSFASAIESLRSHGAAGTLDRMVGSYKPVE